MLSQTIRRAFLKFFQSNGHSIVPSSPVIPHDDPTLLFINAGMNQFKDVFLGKSKRDYTCATSSQKCVRVGGKHNDLENVGHTTRHLTFFEMLGNFSFGDYFKKEAIDFAWEVTCKVFELDPRKIWVSVYKEDHEAFSLWEKHVPKERIVRLGEKDNFWSMGDVGPCGPCSELLYDRGETYGNAKNPAEDATGERFFEFWNLVFMESERTADGKMTPLPKKSVDAGAGLERVVSLKMDVDNVFQTDILRRLISEVEKLSGKKYDGSAPFHVIADHIRTLSFAIADGVTPSNTDRGYILRKVLRRAVRYGRTLKLKKPFLAKLVPCLIELMGEDFLAIQKSQERIEEILTLEEEAFIRTLERGGNLLSQVISSSKEKISGDDAFKLKDTYGFPLEEIELIAKDEGLSIDLPRFTELENRAKEISKKAHKKIDQRFDQNLFNELSPTEFVGYGQTSGEATVVGILVDGKLTETLDDSGVILLNKTPFYAEMGGQVGDTGTITKDGATFQVKDTTAPFPGVIAHTGFVKSGTFTKGDAVEAVIDKKRRQKIANNHTATHLLHLALQEVVSSHIKQSGSLVEDKRLRFDFNHHKGLTNDEILQVENRVNELVREARDVSTYVIPFAEAQKRDDIQQIFGEKYGETVRVVEAGASKELCGGTHTSTLGTIGLFKVIKETSVAAGVRRIEAITGSDAEEFVHEEEKTLLNASTLLKTTPQSLLEKITHLQEENKRFLTQVKEMRKKELNSLIEIALNSKELLGEISFISKKISLEPDEMASFAKDLLERVKTGVIALGAEKEGRALLLVAVSEDLVKKKLSAGNLVKQAAPLIGGGGGGRPNIAQAGGKDPKGLEKAFEKVKSLIQC